jgi:hypothetical protein
MSEDGCSGCELEYASESSRKRRSVGGAPCSDGSRDGAVLAKRTTSAVVELREDDICAVCGQAWVTARELDIYIECMVQRQLASTANSAEEDPRQHHCNEEVSNEGVRGGRQQSPTATKYVPSADALSMMILCDGCDGSFHMICAGM